MTTPRFSILLIGLATALTSCADFRTVIIPRYTDATATADPFGTESLEESVEVGDATYRIVATSFGETLCLGAAAPEGFAGTVCWQAGERELTIAVTAASTSAPVTARDKDLPPVADARIDRVDGEVRITIEIPHGTLRSGDGTLVLEFEADGADETVRVPGTGRLRGIYMKT